MPGKTPPGTVRTLRLPRRLRLTSSKPRSTYLQANVWLQEKAQGGIDLARHCPDEKAFLSFSFAPFAPSCAHSLVENAPTRDRREDAQARTSVAHMSYFAANIHEMPVSCCRLVTMFISVVRCRSLKRFRAVAINRRFGVSLYVASMSQN